jgi:hypothetical protein
MSEHAPSYLPQNLDGAPARSPERTLARIVDILSRHPHADVIPPVTRVEDEATRPPAFEAVRASKLSQLDARRIREALLEGVLSAGALYASMEEWTKQAPGMDAAEYAAHRMRISSDVARTVGRIETALGFALGTMDQAEGRA